MYNGNPGGFGPECCTGVCFLLEDALFRGFLNVDHPIGLTKVHVQEVSRYKASKIELQVV